MGDDDDDDDDDDVFGMFVDSNLKRDSSLPQNQSLNNFQSQDLNLLAMGYQRYVYRVHSILESCMLLLRMISFCKCDHDCDHCGDVQSHGRLAHFLVYSALESCR